MEGIIFWNFTVFIKASADGFTLVKYVIIIIIIIITIIIIIIITVIIIMIIIINFSFCDYFKS